MITPEFRENNILIQFSDLMEAPTLLALISLEQHNPSTDRSDEELQFEEIPLTWSMTHPTINPFVPQTNIQQIQSLKRCRIIIRCTSPPMREKNIPNEIGSSMRECGMQLT